MSFGSVLWETARMATRFDSVKEVSWKILKEEMYPCFFMKITLQRFRDNGAKVEKVDGFTMVTNMAKEVETMMENKIDAIKVNFKMFTDFNSYFHTNSDSRESWTMVSNWP